MWVHDRTEHAAVIPCLRISAAADYGTGPVSISDAEQAGNILPHEVCIVFHALLPGTVVAVSPSASDPKQVIVIYMPSVSCLKACLRSNNGRQNIVSGLILPGHFADLLYESVFLSGIFAFLEWSVFIKYAGDSVYLECSALNHGTDPAHFTLLKEIVPFLFYFVPSLNELILLFTFLSGKISVARTYKQALERGLVPANLKAIDDWFIIFAHWTTNH